MPEWIAMPDWIATMEWLEPKLVLLIALVGIVLWLSNLGNSERGREQKRLVSSPRPLKNPRR